MGAKLRYAKVIDKELFYNKGAKISPGLENEVVLADEPGNAASFLVLRGWSDDHGTFTEQWRIEGPGGGKVFESTPRELHLATQTHIERLEDEVSELEFQYSSDDYEIVFVLDDVDVARTRFTVRTIA
ncbi:MAG TPA: hypothetical protein VFS18_02000 [Actinomycetota bacterium]|nr:hypothetical protein [Actinomycetota bacterium]